LFFRVVGLAGLVFIAAEHWKTTRVYVPSFRHADFNPAEDTIYFEDRFIVHFGGRKVQFDAAKNGGGAAPWKLGPDMRRSQPPNMATALSIVAGPVAPVT